MQSRLELTRQQVLAFRRRVGGLDERLPAGPDSLRRAAWAGLQDSMPRAALLSLHARIEGIEPSSLEHPSLAQLWGPRFHTYVIAERDFAVFSLGRLPDPGKGRVRAEAIAEQLHARIEGIEPSALEHPSLAQLWGPRFHTYVIAERDFAVFSLGRLPDPGKGRVRAEAIAEQLHAHLGGERMTHAAAGHALGVDPNLFKYAAATGTVAIRWDGARAPSVWTVAAPEVDPAEAQRELARRYLHVFGPSTSDGFARWAGISRRAAATTFVSLGPSLVPVRTPLGDEWLLAGDEAAVRGVAVGGGGVRLLPSGDAYFLLDGAERTLLVPDADQRARLWTTRVWPGAVLVDGEIRGTWRRAHRIVRIDPWGRLPAATRAAIEEAAAVLPLPGLESGIVVEWGT